MAEIFQVPNPKTGFGMTPENIKLGAKWGVLPENIKYFANSEDFSKQANLNVPPPQSGSAKYWRDNAGIWTDTPEFQYLFFDWTQSGVNFSDESFNYYSPTAAATYKAYVDVGFIKHIPKLFDFIIPKRDAGRISFAKGVSFDFPVGTIFEDPTGPIPGGFRSSFPSDCLAVFDQVGEILVYKIEDFIKIFPIKNISVGPGSTSGLTDEEFVFAAEQVLKSAKFTPKEKRSKIKEII